MCKRGGGRGWGYVESIYRSKILCVCDQIPNQTKPRRGEGIRHLPPAPIPLILVNFLKKPTFRVWCLYRYLVHGAGIYKGKGNSKYVNYSFVLNLVKLKITDLDWSAKKSYRKSIPCRYLPG